MNRKCILLALGVVVAAGCSVKRVPLRDPAGSRPRSPYDFEAEQPAPPAPSVARTPASARFDSSSAGYETPEPADLDTPALLVQDLPAPERTVAPPPADVPAGREDGGERPAAPAQAANGYRVQVFASTDRATAERMRGEIEARLGERAYVEYQAPYHKVRVGNCVASDDCIGLESRLRQAGYTSVWTVPSPIQP